jgi:methylenetetrahydrofolate dehydrogenase (NADP+)/methenyltetrahydrofolate cyclohydrolase
MPLPRHIDYKTVLLHICPSKDVEGMHPENLGKIILDKARVLPCTAAAVMELLSTTGVNLYGKEVVVVGHSEIVGKPLSLLLLNKFATTTVCHIATSDAGKLVEHVNSAEILIVAVGRANLIRGEWIKEGAIVIDVGINRVDDKIVGDVEFATAFDRAAQITPVPGGVGPLTTTILMRNLIEATKLQK